MIDSRCIEGAPLKKDREQEPSAGSLAALITLASHSKWQVAGEPPIPDSDFARPRRDIPRKNDPDTLH